MPNSAFNRFRLPLLLGAALGLVALSLWLRGPALFRPVWNVDEAIHAAVARTLLDGGVLYRDAVDIRNPLTYYAMAGVFVVGGENNLWAVHCFIGLLVAGTGWLLLLAGRSLRDWAAGAGAALLYVLLATGALYQGDANAANTEWFVAFFSSAAAVVILQGGAAPGPRRLLVAGALSGCAFLSKQPALLDLGAPLALLLYSGWRQGDPVRVILRRLLQLGAGWLGPVVLVVGYLAMRGAWSDFLFYAWTYNLTYYGPEISTADRLGSLAAPFALLGRSQPWLVVAWGAAALATLHRLMQRLPRLEETAANPGLVFVAIWATAGWVGAAASGRGFDHYTIQFLAPFCLGAGLLTGRLFGWVRSAATPWAGRAAAALLLVIILFDAGSTAAAARRRTLPDDPSVRVAAYIRAHSRAGDRIFVWGFQPDIYLFADRRPASRFIIPSFLTGMIPWTNTAPTVDTTYAIVPGTLDQGLADLMASRPVFIVDCSAGPNRSWNKYPLEKFPRLQAFVRDHYLPIESGQFVPQGFRLYAIKDSFRPDAAGGPAPAMVAAPARAGSAGIFSPPLLDGDAAQVRVAAEDSASRLRRLELHLDGRLLDAVSLQPAAGLSVDFSLPVPLPPGLHRLVARAVCDDGVVFESAPHEIDTHRGRLPADELPAFSLPEFKGHLAPAEVSAPYGASASMEDGGRYFYAHAPSRLVYGLPDDVVAVHGGYGIRPGAYAPDNKAPTDGAEFSVSLVLADGRRVDLHRRRLAPRSVEADRGVAPFSISFPPGAGRRLEFVITPGPAGDASSDWAYWTNLTLEFSR